ncbi:hypothetical protein BO71DRAFT_447405 [Aspergillus ellipticus CBS 707.79]|uniref:DUF7587 domain-containing protein n=1 Tax=Aspergillus ellipticus CBS 707.79 TaxID=1448320 RepID=A0A319DVI6_9EURO|nr:hypothetical protein BO71DRAFT_447405 [Aspergillus ellipticus CBS 707.79]
MDSPTSLNLRDAKPRNRWTRDQRLLLCCLYRFFRKDPKVFEEIFNRVYRSEVRDCGFEDGISWSTMNTQWTCMKDKSHRVWGEVHTSPFDKNGYWLPVIERIRETAVFLELGLMEKNETTRDEAGIGDEEVIDEVGIDEADIDEETSLCRGGGKVCFWCEKERLSKIPPVLYRWSNIDSQGVNSKKLLLAGLFADGCEIFSPEDVTKEVFNQYMSKHVHIEKEPSPFISTFKSLLSPVHRAVWNKEGAIITLIDTKKLDNPVYSAYELMGAQDLTVRGYNGGDIAKEDSEIGDFLQLQKIAFYKANRKSLHQALARGAGALDHASGLAIGKLLSAVNIAHEYSKDSFYEGVDAGYGRSSESVVSENECPEPEVYVISDDDSATEYDSVEENEPSDHDSKKEALAFGPKVQEQTDEHTHHHHTPENEPRIRDGQNEAVASSPKSQERVDEHTQRRHTPEHTPEQVPASAQKWSPTEGPNEETRLSKLAIRHLQPPVIETYNAKTGKWVQEQAELLMAEECPSSNQPPYTHGTLEMLDALSSPCYMNIDTDTNIHSPMSWELTGDVASHERFARDRERIKLCLFPGY